MATIAEALMSWLRECPELADGKLRIDCFQRMHGNSALTLYHARRCSNATPAAES